MRTQIAGKRRKIRDIEKENKQLEEKIEAAKSKLDQQTADRHSLQGSDIRGQGSE